MIGVPDRPRKASLRDALAAWLGSLIEFIWTRRCLVDRMEDVG